MAKPIKETQMFKGKQAATFKNNITKTVKYSVKAKMVIFMAIFFVGCITPIGDKTAFIKEADESVVSGCRFIGSVTGTGVGAIGSSMQIKSATNEALNAAAEKGASHIIWTSINQAGYANPSGMVVIGRAYDCSTRK